MAKNVRDHGVFTINPVWGPMSFRTPVYPLFLALTTAGIPSLWFPILIQNILAAFSVVMVFRLARDLFSARAGWVAAILYALEPERPHLASQAMSETLLIFFLLLGAVFFVRLAGDRASGWIAAATGISLGLSALTKPIGLFIPFIFAAVLILSLRKGTIRAAVRTSAIMVVVALVVISPWIIRNGVRFGAFRLSPLGGMTLYYANAAHFLQAKSIAAGVPREFYGELSDQAIADLELKPDRSPEAWVTESTRLMEFVYEPYFRKRFFEIVSADPFFYARLHLKRSAVFFLDSGLSRSASALFGKGFGPPWLFYPFFFWAGRVFWLIVMISIASALIFRRREMNRSLPLTAFWILFGAGLAAMAAMNFDAPRMRVPLDPFTAVLFAGGALAIVARRRPAERQETVRHEHLQHVYEQVPPDYWDKSYRTNPIQRLYHDSRYSAVRRELRHIPSGGRLLDVGCGSGFSIEQVVRERTDIEVYGVDVSPELVAYAKAHRPRFHFETAVGEALPFPEENFDTVTFLDTIEHMVDPARSLGEARRVLRPGGRIVVQVVFEHHPLFRLIWKLWMMSKGKVWEDAHLRVYDRKSLRAEVEAAGFVIESDHLLHLGMSGIVVGRKSP